MHGNSIPCVIISCTYVLFTNRQAKILFLKISSSNFAVKRSIAVNCLHTNNYTLFLFIIKLKGVGGKYYFYKALLSYYYFFIIIFDWMWMSSAFRKLEKDLICQHSHLENRNTITMITANRWSAGRQHNSRNYQLNLIIGVFTETPERITNPKTYCGAKKCIMNVINVLQIISIN